MQDKLPIRCERFEHKKLKMSGATGQEGAELLYQNLPFPTVRQGVCVGSEGQLTPSTSAL